VTTPRLRAGLAATSFLAAAFGGGHARAEGLPHAASVVRILGAHAERTLAPVSGDIGALIAIPQGQSPGELGVEGVAPGIGRLRGSAAQLLAFTDAHPGIHVEVAPPLHTLLDKAGAWVRADLARSTKGLDGSGVLVGIADTGLDVSHPDFLDEFGRSRVAWMLDLSLRPLGIHPALEDRFGIKNEAGDLLAGAVLSGADIDALIRGSKVMPSDSVGHGTHVASIAVGNGGIDPHTPYVGMAPKAQIVFARVTRSNSEAIENDDLLRGAAFLFDRADAEKKPISVNLSLGTDFGPHDGSSMWEKVLSSYVGPDKPGRTLVVAAGNSGSVADMPIHQSVHVAPGATVRVPVTTGGATDGSVQVWVAMHPKATLSVGLDAPEGTWVTPIGDGQEAGHHQNGHNAGVINGNAKSGLVPSDTHGALVLWTGSWSGGEYDIVLEGEGTADLYLEGAGDAARNTAHPAAFLAGVREGTVSLPGTHPNIIAVGCTVNRPRWISIEGAPVSLLAPALDVSGGLPRADLPSHAMGEGDVCFFSGAGPTATGVQKPEISAPGGGVVAALSKDALPGRAESLFTSTTCPARPDGQPGPQCLELDTHHAIAFGTSMSAPLVAGGVALMLERDPTLTQDRIVGLLQAGAHPFRGASPFEDQGGPGELDVKGALDAMDDEEDQNVRTPSAANSWMTLSADYVAADGSAPLTVILELRTDAALRRADLLGERLQALVELDGESMGPSPIRRRAPGVFTFEIALPPGHGGSTLTVGATFDGRNIVVPKSVVIATDIWAREYGATPSGGCAIPARRSAPGTTPCGMAFVVALALALRRRRRGLSTR
jgi:subtilisin family serine protease